METPDLESALFDWVSDQPAVTQYIGAAPQVVRFFKLKAPQGSKTPACVMKRAGRAGQALPCGPDGAVRYQLQVDHYAKTWPEMAGLAKAFKRALEAVQYPAAFGSGDSPGAQLRIKSATLNNEFDSDDPEPGICRRTQFWEFWVFEP